MYISGTNLGFIRLSKLLNPLEYTEQPELFFMSLFCSVTFLFCIFSIDFVSYFLISYLSSHIISYKSVWKYICVMYIFTFSVFASICWSSQDWLFHWIISSCILKRSKKMEFIEPETQFRKSEKMTKFWPSSLY